MASTITSLGVGSGLDLTSLLAQLRTAEESKLTPIATRQSSTQTKISAFGTLATSLERLQEAAAGLSDASLYSATASSGEHSAFDISTGSDAQAGRYEVQVSQLASAHSIATATVSSKTETLGSGSLTLGVGDQLVSIELQDATLESIRDAINAQRDEDGNPLGLTAAIVNSRSGVGGEESYSLVLTSRETGSANAIGTVAFTPAAGSTEDLTQLFAVENRTAEVAAKDAEFTLNGIQIIQGSNQIQGVIDGVDITLKSVTDGQPQVFTIASDTSAIKAAVEEFVGAYNDYLSLAASLGRTNPEDPSNSGALVGNSALRSIQGQLRSALGADAQLGSLETLGITTKLDGSLEIDDAVLSAALSADIDAVSQTLMGSGDSGGLIGRLSSTLEGMLDGSSGLINTATTGLEAQLDRLGQQYDTMSTRIDATMERYRRQFVALDQMMSRMTNLSSQLTQQFDALNSNN
ncbi:flagellar filament capping protein FliD [Halotalea alkalilenta]|uniref:Flagellar hook-associated protein 2 n=1 Tax=Halotalea alkalilenta TaxID=376489 RepID=A0A172YH08_9GAMM|nr:flagellar filament capping protein FliD [Halotalea alkalilenta]ANF58396.1 hypothetical protein A5892_13715 [Halotalea alkalilenta]